VPRTELKAIILRGYVDWLREQGLLELIKGRVDEPLRALLQHPPVSTQWLDAGTTTLPLVDALAAHGGLPMVRRMSYEAAIGPILRIVRPIAEGIVRLAGGVRGVVERLPLVFRGSTRNVDITVAMEPGNQATVLIRSRGLHESPASAEAWAGCVEAMVGLSRTRAVIEVSSLENDGDTSTIGVLLRW